MQLGRLFGGTALAAAATLFAFPTGGSGFSLIGGNLGINTTLNGYQRDVRVWNNAADAAANNNQTAESAYPGALGTVLSLWKAAQAWNSDPGKGERNFDYDFQGETTSNGGTDGNVISWTNSGCGGGTLAYTQTPIANGWTIRMCENWTWSDGPGNPGAGQMDIQGIATHELGHALGLGHSNVGCGGGCSNDATMCAFACGNGVSARDLTQDDKDGMQAIYGAKPGNKPVITSLSGSQAIGGQLTIHGSNFPSTVNVKFTAGTTQNTGSIPGVVFNVPTSGTQLTVTIPNTALDGNVLVWAPASSLLSNAFPIDIGGGLPPAPPVITGLNPGVVEALGAPQVTLQGIGFLSATEVKVGTTTLTQPLGFLVTDDNTITFTPPTATALGAAPITVTNAGGTSNVANLTYVATDPLLLLGPSFAWNGLNLEYTWGGQPNQMAFFLLNGTGATAPFQGQTFLLPLIMLPLPNTNAAGIGSLTAPLNGGMAGTTLHTQILTVQPPGTDESSVRLSNIVVTMILF